MKKLLLIASLTLTSSGYSYISHFTNRERQIYDVGSEEWKQQRYEEEQEEKQKKLDERLEKLEQKQEEYEEEHIVWDFSDNIDIEEDAEDD